MTETKEGGLEDGCPQLREQHVQRPCGGQGEGGEADTVFVLEDGATLKNVIIGADQGEGVYCLGSCNLEVRLCRGIDKESDYF